MLKAENLQQKFTPAQSSLSLPAAAPSMASPALAQTVTTEQIPGAVLPQGQSTYTSDPTPGNPASHPFQAMRGIIYITERQGQEFWSSWKGQL